jgi:hypothetical protein
LRRSSSPVAVAARWKSSSGNDDEPAASRQLQDHVGSGSLGRDLELEVPVPVHSRRFQEVLQHEFAGPAPLRGIREDRAEALHLSQRVVEPGLDLALGLQDRRVPLAPGGQPDHERPGEYADHQCDNDR